jgi:hypothetical protein
MVIKLDFLYLGVLFCLQISSLLSKISRVFFFFFFFWNKI